MKVRIHQRTFTHALLAALACAAIPAHAIDIRVACASNFTATLDKLAADFGHAQAHTLRISSGSTGKLFTQIQHGAPFDIFLSADREHPALLHKEGLAETPFTYAIGRLALYAPAGAPRAMLEHGNFQHLAIANPQTAPYGAAARAVLAHMQLWKSLQPRLVIGENIGQTFQFVHSNTAELGFVALAQVRALNIPQERYWLVPSAMHLSLEQDAVFLRSSHAADAAKQFLEYLQSKPAREIIARDGYSAP